MHFPNDPAVPCLGICPGEMTTHVHTKTHMQMFVAALFIIVKTGNNSNFPHMGNNW